MIFTQYPSICSNFVRATVDNLKYMYTNQIVSTYWVSSAQCIPNSHFNVQNDVKCMLYNKYYEKILCSTMSMYHV